MQIRVSGIIEESIVDGPFIRYVIFTQGCFHNCKGCHNQNTHDINGGYFISFNEILKSIKENPLIHGVTFSGGEPMLHTKELSMLCDELMHLNKSIMIYSGYTFEQIIADKDMFNLLKKCDLLVDGKFDIDNKDDLLRFRGSSNQRVIDVKKSLEHGIVCISEYSEN